MSDIKIGDKFGQRKVIGLPRLVSDGNRRRTLLLVQCQCGDIAEITIIRAKKSQSCLKCGQKKGSHNESSRPEYRVWNTMRDRCHNPKSKYFDNYGGRGIEVCKTWRESYQAFIDDMGYRPSKAHTIERENNDEGYSSDNCRWATRKEQGRNKRNNRYLEYDGKTACISEWGELTGLRPQAIHKRIKRGWSVAEALGRVSRARN